jgi:hypothetical protein
MKRHQKLGTIFSACAIAATLATAGGVGTATADELPGSVTVHNATQILFSDTTPNAFCTIGAVGTDKYGNDIAISAGHCLGSDGGQYDAVPILEDIQPVFDRNHLNWKEGGNERDNDPIGYVRWFKDTDGIATGHMTKDYMVIELLDGVVMSSQGPHIKMTGVNTVPNGTINSPNVVNGPALPQEKILGTGIFTNHEMTTSSYQTGVNYGRITNNSMGALGVYQSHAPNQAGDSGGPAVIRDAGTPQPSAANGYQMQGKWVGITKAIILGFPPYTYTSSANILADLRARDEASGGNGTVFGAGFQVTTNP